MNKSMIGDEVEVINNGDYYSSYERMANKLKATKWEKDRSNPGNGAIGKIINFEDDKGIVIYLIEIKNKEYLFGERGLKLVKKKRKKEVKYKKLNKDLLGL